MSRKLGDRKRRILRCLLELREASVSELQMCTEIPRSSLNHHLRMLRRMGLIEQRRSGKVLVNRVVPLHVQKLREELGCRAPVALISGYTYDPERGDPQTLGLLDRAVRLLEREGVEVRRCIAFTTPKAQQMMEVAKYRRGDEEVPMDISVYQNELPRVEREMSRVIERYLPEYEVVVDLTPLTKLFTIAGVNAASKYCLRAIYHAGRGLIWVRAMCTAVSQEKEAGAPASPSPPG